MKILLISYNRIGDTILATGLISHLLDKYKDASFSIITSSISASIYQNMPRLENLFIADYSFPTIVRSGKRRCLKMILI